MRTWKLDVSARGAALALACLLHVSPAWAESQMVVGGGTASARVNFVVVVPQRLYLGIGATSEKRLQLAVPSATAVASGQGTRTEAVGAEDAQSNSEVVVPVTVYGNQGPVTIGVDHSTRFNGPQGNIAFRQLQVRSSDSSKLPAPVSGAQAVVTTPSASRARITDRHALWVYSYRNDGAAPTGRYEGQAVYTVAMP